MKPGKLSITESSDLLDAFINNTPFGILIIDIQGNVKVGNKLAFKFLGLGKELGEVENIIKNIAHIPDLKNILISSLENKKEPFNIESIFIHDKYFKITGKIMLDGYMVTIEDISLQKEVEVTSIQAILEGQENERRRIGREIHDGFGPLLSYMKLNLDSFIDEVKEQNPNTQVDILYDISETIDSITYDLRALSHSLVPRLLEEFGVKSAFESLVFKLNEVKSINISFYTNIEKDKRFDSELELNIYRSGQELLNNAVKYSKGTYIQVQVILHNESIVLMVEDDGVGFDDVKVKLENTGIGLTNIYTRVRMLNGQFEIDSTPGKGTVASVEIPL